MAFTSRFAQADISPLFRLSSPRRYLPKSHRSTSRNHCSRIPSPFSSPSREFQTPRYGHRLRYRFAGSSPEEPSDGGGFERAVTLFNVGDYYKCHDHLEELWHVAEEPVRTLIHGILQCAVGLHHLFNQNHRGAMMELGEGLCKLRKMDFDGGPFLRFEQEISNVLEFLYQTQKEVAACTSELCLAMDGSERSYQLLGSFAAGQPLYKLNIDQHGVSFIIFCHDVHYSSDEPARVKVPTLQVTEEDLNACEYSY